jgi:hypothetical protein
VTASGKRRIWIDHSSALGAPLEAVSALLHNIDAWPRWSPGLLAILRNKASVPRVGGVFVMIVRPEGAPIAPVPCTLLKLEPTLIEWGGGAGGSVIRHRFELEATGSATCRVRQLEYATGLLALLTRPIEKIARRHDLAWSHALERRFPR